VLGEVQQDERGTWVVVAPSVYRQDDDGNRLLVVPPSRVRLGSLAHRVHAAADERIAASLPRVRP